MDRPASGWGGRPHGPASESWLPLQYRGTSLIRTRPPPQDHHKALDRVLLKGPSEAPFLMSEVPLYISL